MNWHKPKYHSLLDANTRLAREWHSTKNGDLRSGDVTSYSGKKVWWRCRKGHEWQETVANRNNGNGCPYCSHHRTCKETSLKTLYPRLAREWHPTRNGGLMPKDVTSKSARKVWWRCRKGHEWETTVKNRSLGDGCPYCGNRKVCKENCLSTMRPDLAREWQPSKNGKRTPADVVPGETRRVWWRCAKGHEWKASLVNRSRGRGCPYCAGKKVCEDNCLATLNPKLAKEWHPSRNGDLTPNGVTPGSNKRAWWKCGKGHEWRTKVYNRTMAGTGCPHCYNELRRLGFYAGSGTPGVKARARKRASGEGKRR